MKLLDIPYFTAEFFDFLDTPMWRAWPFNAGYGESILPSVARLVFVSFIFGLIILFLRVLFGPNGYFRDEELDREADEMRAVQIAKLDVLLENGEVDEMEYQIELKKIQS
ncbi:MAG: SHOCT domain-containing protein [Pseudodesulfovibrio sp.]